MWNLARLEPGKIAVLPLPRGGCELQEVGGGSGARLNPYGGGLLTQDKLFLGADGRDSLGDCQEHCGNKA